MKGYKVFNEDWTCRGFQYEVGKTYEMNDTPLCCYQGFHFCERLIDCFNYYQFIYENKIAEIEALGEIDSNGMKSCTNKIKIVREISWEEALKLINMGKGCIGLMNCGDFNTGDHNSGQWNTGDYNSGISNQGSCNSGGFNNGHRNSGNHNSGNHNSGDYNSGNFNSGEFNTGYYNSGNYNSGHYNSGDWNKTFYSSGCFNTKEEKITMFNKPSNWTYEDWKNSKARYLMDFIGMNQRQKWWDHLHDWEKKCIMSLPNFDADIFEEITGINVNI